MYKHLAVAALCLAATAPHARTAAAPSPTTASAGWTFSTLGTLGGNVSWATAINNAGQVVGWSGTAPGESIDRDKDFHAYVFANGAMRDLGRAGDDSSAWAINDNGQVAGLSVADGIWLADSKGTRKLGFRGTPYGINRAGVVAGTYDDGVDFRAFTYRGSVMTELGTLGGSWSHGKAINIQGLVVGSSATAAGQVRGFIHERGRMRAIGTFGGPNSNAHDVNDRGVVVGSAGNAANGVEAFIHDGVMRRLFAARSPYDVSEALAINNRGQVVGTINDEGFLFEGGRVTMLRELLTAEERATWGVLTPTDINESGWIVGIASTYGINGIPGGSRKAFVLKPAPITARSIARR